MAKRKRSRNTEELRRKYNMELIGLLIVLITILGVTLSGPIGKVIRLGFTFIMGDYFLLLFICLFLLGIYMMFKGKLPKLYSKKMIGVYIIIIIILTIDHSRYLANNHILLKDTFKELLDKFSNIKDLYINISVGSGIIGATFSYIFISLFDKIGSFIVLIILGLFGIVLLFDFSFAELFNKVKEKADNHKLKINDNKPEKNDEHKYETDNNEDDKVVISSVQELYEKKKEPVARTQNYEEVVAKYSNNGEYVLPPMDLLDKPKNNRGGSDVDVLRNNKVTIERVLNDFQIFGKVVNIHEGPAVTQYEVDVKSGTKLSRIIGINKELALALAAKEVRIMAPIPGKGTVGIEIPNRVISSVALREVLDNIPENNKKVNILLPLGRDIMGNIMTADLTKMPHLLVAGTTGSGKSVCINSIITSILMRYTPDEVKIVLVDPKKVELSNYKSVPHLYLPVVTDPKQASVMLKKIVKEMDRRYEVFSEKECKNLASYNEYMENEHQKHPDLNIQKLPYIVVIIDELADLMLVAAKEVEDSVLRIAQMARAAGIHLIVATQRPSTDVITGIMKANIPSKIAFAVSNGIDSRTIIDCTGAEKLLGKGDMLYFPIDENAPTRIQGTYISDNEIKRVIDFVTSHQTAVFEEVPQDDEEDEPEKRNYEEDYDDPIYNEVVDFAVRNGKVSASLLQRKFRLGFNRAARMIDILEEKGIVGPQNGSKPRDVLVKLENNDSDENN